MELYVEKVKNKEQWLCQAHNQNTWPYPLTSIEEIWIKKLFVSLGQKQENPTIIHSYNQSAIMFLGFI